MQRNRLYAWMLFSLCLALLLAAAILFAASLAAYTMESTEFHSGNLEFAESGRSGPAAFHADASRKLGRQAY
jgi:hypothetical protein